MLTKWKIVPIVVICNSNTISGVCRSVFRTQSNVFFPSLPCHFSINMVFAPSKQWKFRLLISKITSRLQNAWSDSIKPKMELFPQKAQVLHWVLNMPLVDTASSFQNFKQKNKNNSASDHFYWLFLKICILAMPARRGENLGQRRL